MSGNRSKSSFFEGVGHFRQIFEMGRGHCPPISVGVGKLDNCRFVWYPNIHSASFSFVTIHASDRQMDRRTDGQNCESNTVRHITYRTVKTKKSLVELPISGLRGNVRTPSIARCKARGQISVHHN